MARCVWTIALCFLAAGVATAQAPGDEAAGDNVGRAAERQERRATRQSPAEEEEPEESADGQRRRGAEGDRRRGRDEEGEGGRSGGEGRFRRGNPMFEALDADGDQSISTAELKRATLALKKLDADSDGMITLAEASPRGSGAFGGPGGPFGGGGNTEQMVENMLRQFDRNNDGRIGLDEVDARALGMLSRFRDVNGDGALERTELLAGMEQMRQFQGGGGFDGRQMTERMMQNDLNRDGKLQDDEVPDQFRGMLRDADEDGDGAIDARELELTTRRMGERFSGGRGVGGDRGGRGERGGRDTDDADDEEGEGSRRPRRQRPETEDE